MDLRPRLEAVITKALKYQVDSGKPFVQAVAEAMHERPLEALATFAKYLPQEVHAQVSSMAQLHLEAVRQLSIIDVTPEPGVVGEVVGSDKGERE